MILRAAGLHCPEACQRQLPWGPKSFVRTDGTTRHDVIGAGRVVFRVEGRSLRNRPWDAHL